MQTQSTWLPRGFDRGGKAGSLACYTRDKGQWVLCVWGVAPPWSSTLARDTDTCLHPWSRRRPCGLWGLERWQRPFSRFPCVSKSGRRSKRPLPFLSHHAAIRKRPWIQQSTREIPSSSSVSLGFPLILPDALNIPLCYHFPRPHSSSPIQTPTGKQGVLRLVLLP